MQTHLLISCAPPQLPWEKKSTFERLFLLSFIFLRFIAVVVSQLFSKGILLKPDPCPAEVNGIFSSDFCPQIVKLDHSPQRYWLFKQFLGQKYSLPPATCSLQEVLEAGFCCILDMFAQGRDICVFSRIDNSFFSAGCTIACFNVDSMFLRSKDLNCGKHHQHPRPFLTQDLRGNVSKVTKS